MHVCVLSAAVGAAVLGFVVFVALCCVIDEFGTKIQDDDAVFCRSVFSFCRVMFGVVVYLSPLLLSLVTLDCHMPQ